MRRVVLVAIATGAVLALGATVGAAVQGHSSEASVSAGQVPSAVDIGFSQDMIVHHEQAVLMAQLVRNRTKDAQVAALAAGIEDDQLLDIGALRGYLTLWHAPMLPSGPPMQWMAEQAAMTTMPGMATTAQLNALRTATGPALDRMFLQLMLRHHDGGQVMLADATAHAGIDVVRALAARMAFDQRQESQTIAALLAGLK
jgi:uncharacterized protein (DUF305 family)